MSTQTSQLVSNLQNIYNEKLLIKSAIGTNSDNFLEYHTLIQNAISEGGGSGDNMNPFYAEYVDGPIISAGTDVVEGTNGNLMIESDLEFYYEGDPVTEDGHDIDTIEFNTILYDPDDDSITYPAHVILTGEGGVESIDALLELWVNNEDYQEDLYGNITITVKSWTATESEDPSEDGYDYLIECQGLNYINAMENNSNVEEITENGFFINDTCAIGFNVNIEGAQSLTETAVLFTNTDSSSQVEFIGLPLDISNGSYFPFRIEAAPYYTCPDGPAAEELNYLEVNTWLADNGIMGSEPLDDFVIWCCNMKNTPLALTNVKFNSQEAATLDSNADGVLYRLVLMTDFNPTLDPNSDKYDNKYYEVNINSNDNLIDFSDSGHKLILMPISSGDNNIYFRYEGDSTVNQTPIIKIYNGWTGRMLVENEDFTIVSSWS